MIKIICFLIPINCFIAAGAQNRITDTSATCIAFWKNGEQRILEISHGKEKYDSSILKSKTRISYEAHLKILDSTANGFTIEWIYKNFRSPGLNEQSRNITNSIMEGLKLLYKTNDVGSFSELLNWKEVRDFAFGTIEGSINNEPGNKTAIDALNQVKAMFQTKENIEAVLIREIQLYHTPYGSEYSRRGESVSTELPNVTGGAPFPATITVKLNEINVLKDYCIVSLNQVIDKEKAGSMIVDLLNKLAGASLNEEVTKKDIESLEISDTNEFVYSISDGWLSRAFYNRTANIAGFKLVETYEIRQKK
ncbi:MAG TPA: hypothetical protein VK489_14275 [Ferruginibacter sp.]|nr:hypothetical protein [Ferruginibacter sp.]